MNHQETWCYNASHPMHRRSRWHHHRPCHRTGTDHPKYRRTRGENTSMKLQNTPYAISTRCPPITHRNITCVFKALIELRMVALLWQVLCMLYTVCYIGKANLIWNKVRRKMKRTSEKTRPGATCLLPSTILFRA